MGYHHHTRTFNYMKKLTTDQFISMAISVHGSKYDYSKSIYTKSREKLTITCPIHGDWYQSPNDHTSGGCGCPSCKFDLIASQKRHSHNHFVNNAQQVHCGVYDYGKVQYINAITKVEIVCYTHGSFFQTPDKHVTSKTGCPKCSCTISKGERVIQQIFDSNNIIYEREKQFPGLTGSTKNSRLRYDFWLPQFNTLIEFDGEQHFSPVRTKGKISSEEAVKKHLACVKNDKVKNEYAQKNGYHLVRIHHSELPKLNLTYIQQALGITLLPDTAQHLRP